MALSELERAVLRKAQDALRLKKAVFVCYAIDYACVPGSNPDDLRKAKKRLTRYVMKRLSGRATVAQWFFRKYERWLDNDIQRKVRIAWISWMLGEEPVFDGNTKRVLESYMNPLCGRPRTTGSTTT
jgi:hypothetical protein